MGLKCIKRKCKYYLTSSHSCKLLSKKQRLFDECFGIKEAKNKREEIGCEIQTLTQEYEYLGFLEAWVKDNQQFHNDYKEVIKGTTSKVGIIKKLLNSEISSVFINNKQVNFLEALRCIEEIGETTWTFEDSGAVIKAYNHQYAVTETTKIELWRLKF